MEKRHRAHSALGFGSNGRIDQYPGRVGTAHVVGAFQFVREVTRLGASHTSEAKPFAGCVNLLRIVGRVNEQQVRFHFVLDS